MEVQIHGVYKHFKGNLYIVEDIALNSQNLEKMVVYRALYGEKTLWVRPYKEFVEEVLGKNQKYRFELQNVDDKRE